MCSLENLSQETYKNFINLFTKNHDEKVYQDIALFLPLVIEEEKRGCLSTLIRNTQKELEQAIEEAEEILAKIGLEYRINKDKYSATIYITKDKEALQRLDIGKEDENLGYFIGVPEEDNMWFEEDNTPDLSEVEKEERSKYMKLIPWICRPTEKRIKYNRNLGRKWYLYSARYKKEYGFDEAYNYANTRINL